MGPVALACQPHSNSVFSTRTLTTSGQTLRDLISVYFCIVFIEPEAQIGRAETSYPYHLEGDLNIYAENQLCM